MRNMVLDVRNRTMLSAVLCVRSQVQDTVQDHRKPPRSFYHGDMLTTGQRSLSLVPIPDQSVPLENPGSARGDVQTRWATVHNPQYKCRVCLTEKRKLALPILHGCSGQLMSPKWISKTSAELVFLSVGSTMPNEPFTIWSWIRCAHWDTSTTAAHGEMVQLVGIQNESCSACFNTSSKPKSQSCIVSWHMSRVLTTQSPLFLEEPCVKIYTDLRTSTADTAKHDHNLS